MKRKGSRGSVIQELTMALILVASFACAGVHASGQEPVVKHPNLLLNRDEIEQVKAKIRDYQWAARLFERIKKMAEDPAHNIGETALCYVLTGEGRYGEMAGRQLLDQARYMLPKYEKLDLKAQPEWGAWSPWGTWAWAYDLAYDTFSDEEQQVIERWLRTGCESIIEGERLWTTTPNLVFDKHARVGLVGFCLGDRDLIEWGLNDPGAHGPERGGFYQVLDTMIKDGHFWGETPIYAIHYDVHQMLALAEAALHYDGTDLYRYVSKKSGASIKSIIDGYLLMAYPLERTGIGGGSIRLATYGDGSTSYSAPGYLGDTFLVNPAANLGLEVAYHRYKDPGYAWILSLNPNRDSQNGGRSPWSYFALTHGEPLPENATPPEAPSGIYPGQGFAFLRSDESPAYWAGGAPTAMVMLGKLIGHGHKDYFSLVVHGKGRLLYPDVNVIQYEPTYLNWTREGIAHSTLIVDHESPRPGPFTTKHDFNSDVKFFAINGTAYQGVAQTRTLLLTKEYLADFFHAADTKGDRRTYDWALHGLGRFYPGNPAAYRPTNALVPYYWWVYNERGREVATTWQADWIQRTGGVTKGLQFADQWFEQEVGVRMTMLGVEGTEVYCGDGPITDGPPHALIEGNPEGSVPLVVARRRAPQTTFAAVHEPYDSVPQIQQVRRVAETAKAIAVEVRAEQYTDYLMAAFDDKEHTLGSREGRCFAFADYAYLRLSEGKLNARGKLRAFRLRVQDLAKEAEVTINGKKASPDRDGQFVVFGTIPKELPAGPEKAEKHDVLEQAAWLHCWFQPEEAHLSSGDDGGEKELELHLRCVGSGQVQGRLRAVAPEGIGVEPHSLSIGPLSEGQEQILRIVVRKTAHAETGLYNVKFVPEGALRAAEGEFLVSVGVVITEDKRVPHTAQYVIRAPGYTMKVDQFSGVSYYLLDADGHRRYGRMHNTNFINGFGAVMREGKWCFRFRHPCRFIWHDGDALTVGCDGTYGDHDVRLRYTFHEDRIVIGLVPPTRPAAEHIMWLGNFDALGKPRHDGTQQRPWEPIVASRFFFPHPAYRQGLLIELQSERPLRHYGSAVSFPLQREEEVTLRFAEQSEATGLEETAK